MNTHRTPRPKTYAAAILVAALIQAASASAQVVDPPIASPSTDSETVQLSTFEVESTRGAGYRATNSSSGTRINTKLMDVPQTISVLTSDFIDDLGALDLDEALIYASGVTTNGFSAGSYSIRGFGTGEPRRNGISFPSTNAIHSAVVDRVEVVKGPSSALYGTGGPGGVINVITKQPQSQRATSLSASVDSEGSVLGQVDTTGPLVENGNLLYRLVVAGQEQRSTRQFGERRAFTVAPSLRYNLRKGAHPSYVTVLAEWLHVPHMISSDERFPQIIETRPAPIGGNPNRMIDIGVAYPTSLLPHNFSISGPNAKRKDDEQYFEFNFVHTFNDTLSARVIYADSRRHQVRFTQFANGGLKLTAAGNLPTAVPIHSWRSDTDQWSRTVQADLSYTQVFSWAKVNVVGSGKQTASSMDHSVFRNLTRPAFNLLSPTAADYNLGVFPRDYSHLILQRNANQARQINLIGNLMLFDERLNFIGAANRSFVIDGIEIRPDLRSSGGQAPSTVITPSGKFDSFQGGLAYRLMPGLSVFYSYSESIQSNAPTFPNDPQKGEGNEGGVRFDLLNGRLSGSVSYFNVERANIPRRDPNLPGGVTRLSGMERSRGYEIDLFWFPTDALQFVANYVDMDPVVVSNTAAPVTEGSLIDAAFPRAFNAFGKYTFKKGSARGIHVSLGTTYRSEMRPYGTLENLYLLTHAPYTVFNAGVGYSWKKRGTDWHIDVMVKNLTNEFYFTDTSIPGEGRVATVTVGMKF